MNYIGKFNLDLEVGALPCGILRAESMEAIDTNI